MFAFFKFVVMDLIQLTLKPFSPQYFIVLRKPFSLISGSICGLLMLSFYEVRDISKENAVSIQLNHYEFEGSKGPQQCTNNNIQSVLKVFIMSPFNKYLSYCPLYCKCFESLNGAFCMCFQTQNLCNSAVPNRWLSELNVLITGHSQYI